MMRALIRRASIRLRLVGWYAAVLVDVIGGYVFRVSDTGMGITPEDQMHLSERFYRVEKSRNRTAGGSGLGLAIANRLSKPTAAPSASFPCRTKIPFSG